MIEMVVYCIKLCLVLEAQARETIDVMVVERIRILACPSNERTWLEYAHTA